jgi:hypothetical protein
MSNSIYSQIQTFDELCKIGCEYIENKIKVHPFLNQDQTKDNLYELNENNEWIRNYLYAYNLMGFFTIMSQPGSDYPIQIYPTYLNYKKSFGLKDNIELIKNNLLENNKSANNYGVKQRAEIEGFIKLDKGLILYDKLKDDPRIKIGLGTFTNGSGSESKSINNYITLSYEKLPNGNIRFMEMEAESNELARKELEGSDRNYKLSKLYHVVRKFFVVRNYSIKKHIPNLSDNDIIGISLMDLEWNKNDYLWDKIYLCLKQI